MAASGAEAAAPLPGLRLDGATGDALQTLRAWAQAQNRDALAQACERYARQSPSLDARALPGPTGESNLYALQPREAVLCLAEHDDDRLLQLAAVLAVDGLPLWPSGDVALLPAALQARVRQVPDWRAAAFDAVLLHGDAARRRDVLAQLAQRPGPLVLLQAYDPGDTAIALERLVVERSLSINTAAAGGNASLMAIG